MAGKSKICLTEIKLLNNTQNLKYPNLLKFNFSKKIGRNKKINLNDIGSL